VGAELVVELGAGLGAEVGVELGAGFGAGLGVESGVDLGTEPAGGKASGGWAAPEESEGGPEGPLWAFAAGATEMARSKQPAATIPADLRFVRSKLSVELFIVAPQRMDS
jgi:hypothetical protein